MQHHVFLYQISTDQKMYGVVLARHWGNRHCYGLLGAFELVPPLWKAIWGYLSSLQMHLHFDRAIPLLERFPTDLLVHVQRITSVCQ